MGGTSQNPEGLRQTAEKALRQRQFEEEEGAIQGSPLAQPLMDTPETDPETQPLVGPRDERDGLLFSTPREVEGDHGLGELRADKVNEKDVAQAALLKKIYYTPGEVGSFGRLNPLFQVAKKHSKTVNRRQVTAWLSDQDAYTLHKPARIRFKRNKTVVSDVDAQWQADLVDMHQFSKQNSNFKYILTVVDILSKYAWALGLRDKTSGEVCKAFKAIFSEGRVPQKLQTDRGKEFLNKPLSRLLKRHGIHHFVTNNEVKAGVVERFNRTLKTRMWRYFTAHNTFRYIDTR
ncbi:unnamed protein product [Natator depressus]